MKSSAEDPSLLSLKVEIKKWEKNFLANNGQKPSSEDIGNAPKSIKELYVKYKQLKGLSSRNETKEDKFWNSTSRQKIEPRNFIRNKKEESTYKRLSCNLKKNISFPTSNLSKKETINTETCTKKTLNVSNGDAKKESMDDDVIKTIGNKSSCESNNLLQISNVQLNDARNAQSIQCDLDDMKSRVKLAPKSSILGKSKLIAHALPICAPKNKRSIDEDWLKRCNSEIKSFECDNFELGENPIGDFSSYENVSHVPNKCNDTNFKSVDVKKNESIKSASVDNSSSDLKSIVDEISFNKPNETKTERSDVGDDSSDKSKFESDPAKVSKVSHKQSSKTEKIDLKCNVRNNKDNQNFVKINLKRKRYSRRRGGSAYQAYKKSKWKKFRSGSDASLNEGALPTFACYKCGNFGHLAKFCQKEDVQELLSLDDFGGEVIDESPFLTLKEAAELAEGFKPSEFIKKIHNSQESQNGAEVSKQLLSDDQDHRNDTNYIDKSLPTTSDIHGSAESIFQCHANGQLPETPSMVHEALYKMGHSSFRPGQEKAIMRTLCGLSSLVILSTGSGKSLCYQLPAYLYSKQKKYITLVISPLVSLMEDQVNALPRFLKGFCYHTNQTPTQRKKVLQAVTDGNCDILLISPEVIVGGNGYSGFLPSMLPTIAFVCIDEAHCLSDWSHNFRPSYLRLYKILTEKYGVKCFLNLTATATSSTIDRISHHLNLSNVTDAIIKGSSLPSNLVLSVSKDKNKEAALLSLLESQRFHDVKSLIIYCTRRQSTERLASLIRINLKNEASSGKRLSSVAEAYHAGLSAAKRKSVQASFMTGKLRIVVATVAFGMGLDKSDVRAVVHYNMPKSFENYVQEIGRAGRDGLTSYCHVFLDPEENDCNELKRHIFSNSLDRHTLRKLIREIFTEKSVGEISGWKNEKEVAIPISEIVMKLDVKEETISTLLCYLELHPKKWLNLLNPVYARCEIHAYSGMAQLKKTSKKCPPLAAAIAYLIKQETWDDKVKSFSFPVVDVSSLMGWESSLVKKELKKLEWNNDSSAVGEVSRRTGITVNFSELAFHVKVKRRLTDNELDEILDFLYDRLNIQEQLDLSKLRDVHSALSSISTSRYYENTNDNLKGSEILKDLIVNYFEDKSNQDKVSQNEITFSKSVNEVNLAPEILNSLKMDVRDFYFTHNADHSFTGRAISRIFHGIGSPCYPAEVWGKVHRYWRSHLNIDFNFLVGLANQEILKFR